MQARYSGHLFRTRKFKTYAQNLPNGSANAQALKTLRFISCIGNLRENLKKTFVQPSSHVQEKRKHVSADPTYVPKHLDLYLYVHLMGNYGQHIVS